MAALLDGSAGRSLIIGVMWSCCFAANGQSNSNAQLGAWLELDNAVLIQGEVNDFDSTKHTYRVCDSDDGRSWICMIDEQAWFGSDQGMALPRNELRSLVAVIQGDTIALEVSAMFNPNWNNELRPAQFKVDRDGNACMIYAFFSDGAGTYTAHWRVTDGVAERVVLSNDERDFEWQLED
ncbi:MAG: hypothetical protein R2818_15645 [Flavobacteriales bacterium]